MRLATNYNVWLLDRARPHLGSRVLDAGAGTGTFTEMAAADGRELVVAMEPDPLFADELELRFAGRENVEVVQLEVDDVSRGTVPAPFDSVVCFNVLEHIRDHAAALARLREVLAPDGRLFLLVPAHPLLFGSIDRTVGHERRYKRGQVRGLLERGGFQVEEVRYVNPLGALGWLVSARILRRTLIPEGPLRLYDRVVPLLRGLESLHLPWGLSVWAVARRPSELA